MNEELEKALEAQAALNGLIRDAMSDAEEAFKFAVGCDGVKENKDGALALASSCIAKSSAAKALYAARFDDLAHVTIEPLLRQFDAFVRELQRSAVRNRGHQWTDSEFEKLKTMFENSVCVG